MLSLYSYKSSYIVAILTIVKSNSYHFGNHYLKSNSYHFGNHYLKSNSYHFGNSLSLVFPPTFGISDGKNTR